MGRFDDDDEDFEDEEEIAAYAIESMLDVKGRGEFARAQREAFAGIAEAALSLKQQRLREAGEARERAAAEARERAEAERRAQAEAARRRAAAEDARRRAAAEDARQRAESARRKQAAEREAARKRQQDAEAEAHRRSLQQAELRRMRAEAARAEAEAEAARRSARAARTAGRSVERSPPARPSRRDDLARRDGTVIEDARPHREGTPGVGRRPAPPPATVPRTAPPIEEDPLFADLFTAKPVARKPVTPPSDEELPPYTGADLLAYRKASGLTQGLLARQCGVQQGTVSKAESKPDEVLGWALRRALWNVKQFG